MIPMTATVNTSNVHFLFGCCSPETTSKTKFLEPGGNFKDDFVPLFNCKTKTMKRPKPKM